MSIIKKAMVAMSGGVDSSVAAYLAAAGMRLHFVILAALAGIPLVALYLWKSEKY